MNWFLGNCPIRGDLGSAYLKTQESREVQRLCVQLWKHRRSWGPADPARALNFQHLHSPVQNYPLESKLVFFQKNGTCVFSKFSLKTKSRCNSACTRVSWRTALHFLSRRYLGTLLIYKTLLWVTSISLGQNTQLTSLFMVWYPKSRPPCTRKAPHFPPLWVAEFSPPTSLSESLP